MKTSNILIDLDLAFWNEKLKELKGLVGGRVIRMKVESYLPGARRDCDNGDLMLATKCAYLELATRRQEQSLKESDFIILMCVIVAVYGLLSGVHEARKSLQNAKMQEEWSRDKTNYENVPQSEMYHTFIDTDGQSQ